MIDLICFCQRLQLTGTDRHLPCFCRCKRRIFHWTIGPQSQRRWSGRGGRRPRCWTRFSGSWWRNRRRPSVWEPSWWSSKAGGREGLATTSSCPGSHRRNSPCKKVRLFLCWEDFLVNDSNEEAFCSYYNSLAIIPIGFEKQPMVTFENGDAFCSTSNSLSWILFGLVLMFKALVLWRLKSLRTKN